MARFPDLNKPGGGQAGFLDPNNQVVEMSLFDSKTSKPYEVQPFFR